LRAFQDRFYLFRLVYPKTPGSEVGSIEIPPNTPEYITALSGLVSQIRGNGLGACLMPECKKQPPKGAEAVYPLERDFLDDGKSILLCRCPNCHTEFVATVSDVHADNFYITQEGYTHRLVGLAARFRQNRNKDEYVERIHSPGLRVSDFFGDQ